MTTSVVMLHVVIIEQSLNNTPLFNTDLDIYHLPLILTALLYVDLINVAYYGMCLYQFMLTLHFLNDVVNDIELTQKSINIASLSSELACKLINRIPGSRLLISSLPGSASGRHVESLCKPRDVNKSF